MAVPSRSQDSRTPDETSLEPASDELVSTHETRPGRIVFTETGNSDGWIATDLTVDPWQ